MLPCNALLSNILLILLLHTCMGAPGDQNEPPRESLHNAHMQESSQAQAGEHP